MATSARIATTAIASIAVSKGFLPLGWTERSIRCPLAAGTCPTHQFAGLFLLEARHVTRLKPAIVLGFRRHAWIHGHAISASLVLIPPLTGAVAQHSSLEPGLLSMITATTRRATADLAFTRSFR